MPDTDSTLIARLRAAVGPDRLAFVATLVVLVAAVTLGLEVVQVAGLDEPVGVTDTLQIIRSEVFVAVALAAFGVGVCLLPGPDRLRRIGLVGVQLIGAFVVFANVAGHFFFQATGSILSGPLLVHGLGILAESPAVIVSEIPVVGWAILAVGLAVIFGAPPLAARLVGGSDPAPRPAARPRTAVASLAMGLIALPVAALPAGQLDYDVGFSRDQGLHLVMTSLTRTPTDADDADPRFDIGQLRLEETDEPDDQAGPTNVAFIILESVRASATTPYNPELETTPYLDELAEESIFFEHAYAVVPHTSKALVALLCGVPPRIEMEIVEAQPGGTPGRCMPTALADHDYRSLFVQSATEEFEFRRGLVANMGYDEFIPLEEMETDGYEEANYFGVEDDVMLPYSRRWHESGDEPFMTTYLTITPHHDYRAPETYGHRDFADDDTFDRYLNSVRYVDQFVQNLIDQYRELDLYDDTLFVIVGDHGEAFGEHGREQHDNVPWQEGIHVPMMIHDGSGQLEARTVEQTASHIDLAPTIFELVGFEVRDADYPGYAASQLESGRITFFSCWFDEQCAGLVRGGVKYIHHFNNRPDEMFDVIDDPAEQNNLLEADYSPPIDADPVERIFGWMSSVDAAYQAHGRQILDRRVLADHPGLAHAVDARVGDALEVTSWEWDDAPRGAADLLVTLSVLRDFSDDDEVEFVVEFASGKTVSHTPMRGVYPALFWQEGQVLVDRIPAGILDGDREPTSLAIVVDGHEVDVSEMLDSGR